jgi:hypothetical protein
MKMLWSALVALSSIQCNAKNFAAFSHGNVERGGIIQIQKRVQAWNIDCNCTDPSSLVGGHVRVLGIGMCIVPICRRCNYFRNSLRFQDSNGNSSYLRAYSELMKTDFTTDMKNAPRRLK